MAGSFGNGFCEPLVGVEGTLGALLGTIIGLCGTGGSSSSGVICDFSLATSSGMACSVSSEVMFCCVSARRLKESPGFRVSMLEPPRGYRVCLRDADLSW
jgi:hypothetical protein